MTDQPVFRFAPSPNGPLHLGHALSALVTHDMARALRARFLLRIEDIDLARCRREFETQILDDLAWLGLSWEERVRRQSEHFETYQQALGKLGEMGLLYPCFATRKEIIAHAVPDQKDPDGAPLYPGLHKGLPQSEIERYKAAGKPFALRLDMGKAIETAQAMSPAPLTFSEIDPESGQVETISANPARWGDTVMARKDISTSYHIAVVADDALQGITHVIRGRDLYAATDIHRLLQKLLGLPEPLYHHHRLIADESGSKLSKSNKAKSLASLREAGASPADIRHMTGLAEPQPLIEP